MGELWQFVEYRIHCECHTFDLELYWPGGPVRMETNKVALRTRYTGPTGTVVVICIIVADSPSSRLSYLSSRPKFFLFCVCAFLT